MKIIPIPEIFRGKKIAIIEDSIVRGTQLGDAILRLFDEGAKEIHIRPSCPPIVYVCNYLNFSSTKSASLLAARKAVRDIIENPADCVTFCAGFSNRYSRKQRSLINGNIYICSLFYPSSYFRHMKFNKLYNLFFKLGV